jgi:peptidyl-prolyl cis-trans isomerase C
MTHRSIEAGAVKAGTLLVSILLAACNGGAGGGATASSTTPSGSGTIQLANPGASVETVNGEAVPQRLLDALAKSRNWDLSNPKLHDRALIELTNFVIAAQASKDAKMSDIDLPALAELGRLQALSAATTLSFQSSGDVDDATLRAEYDKQAARMGGSDYDITFLQFSKDKEAEANKAASEIAGGKKFETVAEAHKASATMRPMKNIRSAQLPEAMAKALADLKPGETAKAPVQTPLGLIVVRLDKATAHEAPTFEAQKENLKRMALKRTAEDRLNKLRSDAKVDPPLPAAPATPPGGPGGPGGPMRMMPPQRMGGMPPHAPGNGAAPPAADGGKPGGGAK